MAFSGLDLKILLIRVPNCISEELEQLVQTLYLDCIISLVAFMVWIVNSIASLRLAHKSHLRQFELKMLIQFVLCPGPKRTTSLNSVFFKCTETHHNSVNNIAG